MSSNKKVGQGRGSNERNSPLSVVIVAEELSRYIFQITANEKQFPRAYRPTLVQDIRNTCISINKKLYVACSITPRTEEDHDRIRKAQNKIYDKLIELKALITMASSVANLKNPNHLAKLFDTMVDAFNRWGKNNRRNYNKFKWKENTPLIKRREAHVEAVGRRLRKHIKRDEDGFAVLERVDPNKPKKEPKPFKLTVKNQKKQKKDDQD